MTLQYLFSRIDALFAKINARMCNLCPGVKIGSGTKLYRHAVLNSYTGGGKITVGRNCEILQGARIYSMGGSVTIGDNVSVNPYTIIYGNGKGVKIGDYTRIAGQCMIVAANHVFADPDVPITHQGMESKGINIGRDVWLGGGVRVVDGVSIADGCVIGAGSVVTKSTEPYGIYVGVPAKLVGRRGNNKENNKVN